MRASVLRLLVLGSLSLALARCNCGNVAPLGDADGGSGGGGAGATGGAGGSAGGSAAGGAAAGGSAAGGSAAGGAPDGGWGTLPDGGCGIATCGGQRYQCGNCLDDDGDGLADSRDPDCLGPCHNNERGFATGIPSFSATACNRLDCYYDTNQGFGEGCRYTHACDPLEPSAPACMYSPGGGAACTTSQMCRTYCEPLTPAGCDCYGCCTAFLPDGGSRDIYLGSDLVNGGRGLCTIATVSDPTICRACTKAADCGKGGCGPCQLCLGRTSLPPECFPPTMPDGGAVQGDGGAPGTLPDGGSLARCASGVQACGLPSDPPCPFGGFCQTGCCIFIQ